MGCSGLTVDVRPALLVWAFRPRIYVPERLEPRQLRPGGAPSQRQRWSSEVTDTSIRTDRPPGQGPTADEDRLLGEHHPAKGTRLTLRAWGDEVILWRHRSPGNSGPDADPAAYISRVDGRIHVEWDAWHCKHKPVWMPSVEDWIRDTLAAS